MKATQLFKQEKYRQNKSELKRKKTFEFGVNELRIFKNMRIKTIPKLVFNHDTLVVMPTGVSAFVIGWYQILS